MSYWSDEAVQKRAAEQEEMRLQWKFRGCTTSDLELRLENNGMSEGSRKSIELELVRRGATYIKRSYYDRPSKFFGSDGAELIIIGAGSGAGKSIYDWDRMVAAESAYIDEVLAKPIPKASRTDMSTFLESQKVLIRRFVPGLISLDSISSGVQPLNKHIDHLSFFKAMKTQPFEDYKFTAEDVDNVISLDKDLQPVAYPHFWSDRISQQSIGRGLRPTVKYGDLHISDYMGLIHTNEAPKTSTGIKSFMDSIRDVPQGSFFDAGATSTVATTGGDFFDKMDTSKWITECKAIMDKYVEGAMTVKTPYFADRDVEFMYQHAIRPIDIMDDSVSKMYPHTLQAIDLSMANKCVNIPVMPITKCADVTLTGISEFDTLRSIYVEVAKASTRGMYYTKPYKSQIITSATEGLFPPRCEPDGGWKLDEMISTSMPTAKEKSVMTVDIPKARDFGGPVKYVKFDLSAIRADLSESSAKQTKEEDVAETLKLLGIGVKE